MTSRIAVPLLKPEDVIPHLGKQELHWRQGYSAKAVAESWFHANDLPPPVRGVLEQAGEYRGAVLIDAWLERETELPWGRGRPTQTDLLALVRLADRIAVVGIEAKVKESFGPLVSEWIADGGDNRHARLNGLCALFGLDPAAVGGLRYQLLHRVAGSVLEAKRFCAGDAAMLVQSFCSDHTGHADFAAFASQAGFGEVAPGQISEARVVDGVSLRLGWVADLIVD